MIKPLLDTVAAAELVDDHENVTPLRTFPDASLATACACIVESDTIDDEGAVTVIVAIGAETTVSVNALDVTVPTVAVMFVVPGPTPVAMPTASTVATDALLEVQAKPGSLSVSPAASSATARNGSDADIATWAASAPIRMRESTPGVPDPPGVPVESVVPGVVGVLASGGPTIRAPPAAQPARNSSTTTAPGGTRFA